MKSTAVVLPLAAGILGVGALIYIYYRQRDKDKKKKTTNNNDKNGISVSNDTIEVLEFKVPNVQVPLIVGRNSLTLKSIEDKTATTIRFREGGDEDHQICCIKGKAANVKIAKELVDTEGAKPTFITEELIVSTSSCGKLEGYCGSVLHEICQKSSAKVWIDPGTRKVQGENRRVLITGTQEQVELAKKLIDEKMKEPAVTNQVESEPAFIDDQKKSPRPSPYASNSSITTTELPREIMLPSPEKLKSNDGQLEVYVSSVASPSRFWVQLSGPQTTELDFLVDAMTEYYNLKENQELHQIREPYLGQIVAAYFLADNKWYRAEIVAIQPNDDLKDEIVLDVYFLDYGDQQFVNKKHILELRADFLSLRFQAVECFLAHIKPNETSSKFEEWDQKAIQSFEEMVQPTQWKKLISKVVTYKERKSFALQRQNQRESSPIPGVELYEENSDKSIALELVKLGYAELSDRFGDLTKSSVLTVVDDEPVEEKKKEEEEISVSSPSEENNQQEVTEKEEIVDDKKEEEIIEVEEPEKQVDETPEVPEIKETPQTQPTYPEKKEDKITQIPPEQIDAPPSSRPVQQNNNNNNLEPSLVSNGKSNAFGGSVKNGNMKPKNKKKKQDLTADFLSMEQQQNAPPSQKKTSQDWNQMMDD